MNSLTELKFEESECIEFKEIFTDKIKCEIIAFLNTNGGKILVGINDDGCVIGVNNRDEVDGVLSSWIRDSFFPNITPYISYYYDDYDVLVIEVKEGKQKPYYLTNKGPVPSGVYIRIGRSCRKANEFEILQMIRDSSGYSYEQDKSLEQNLHFTSLKMYFDKENIEFNVSKHKTLNLINKDGEYTNLGYLLSDENNIEVKLAVYKGTNSCEFKVKKELTGSMISIAHQILDYAKLFNDTSAKIVGYQLERIEQKSYPDIALREAIINAVCHCDYSRLSNIKIEFYDDKVVITSPGGIYGGISLDDIFSGKQSFRNPGLINVFSKLNMIENYGTGIQRICGAYRNFERGDIFIVDKNFFTVILKNVKYISQNVSCHDSQNDSLNDSKNISDIEKKVFNLIKSNPLIKRSVIAKIIGVSERTIYRIIKKIRLKENLEKETKYDSQNVSCHDSQNDSLSDRANVSETEEEIQKIIRENPSIKRNEIAKIIGLSERTVYRIIKKIKETD